MSYYNPGDTREDMSRAYDSCATCKYVRDHVGAFQCTHPDRDSIMVYCIAANAAGKRERYMKQRTNYMVESDEWCSKFKAADTAPLPRERKAYA